MNLVEIFAGLGALTGLSLGAATGFHFFGLAGAIVGAPLGFQLGLCAGGLTCLLLFSPLLLYVSVQERQLLRLCIAAKYEPRPH